MYEGLIKQNAIFKKIKKDLIEQRSSHAYIFVNQDRLYLKSFILMLIASIYCKDKKGGPCLECDYCKQTLGENNLNLKIYDGPILVGDIKNIISDIYVPSLDNGQKIYFFVDASEMNIWAQNKFLKTLEEPDTDVMFFLGCTNTFLLSDTVKSRCRTYNIPLCEKNELESLVNIQDEERRNFILAYSNGMPSLAQKMQEDELYYDVYKNLVMTLLEMNSSRDVLKYMKYFKSSLENLEALFFIFERMIDKVINYSVGLDVLDKNIESISKKYNASTMHNIENVIIKEREKIQRNCKKEVILEEFLYSILEVRSQCQQI